VAAERPVEEVPGVELDTGLCRLDLERAPAGRIGEAGDAAQTGAPQREAVVVAAAVLEPLRLGDARADPRGPREVERRAAHGAELPGRDALCVDGQIAVGGEPELVVEHRAGAAVGEVPVGVARQVHDRRAVAARAQLDAQRVVVRAHSSPRPRARRDGLVTVRARDAEANPERPARRPSRVEPPAAVEVVRAVVAQSVQVRPSA
jgi:hypothetical protein